jgi:carboxyl-terminal processing protease
MRKSRKKRLLSILIPAVILLAALAAAIIMQRGGASRRDSADNLQLFAQVYTMVKARYVEEVDGKKLINGAITGMLAALDPHSSYMPPAAFKETRIHLSGSFGGVGIELGTKDGKLTVIAPIEDTPAFRAGIKAGDHIWKIDGKPTRGMNINAAVGLMRGQKDTKVTLVILREGKATPLVYPLVRDTIQMKSLQSRTIEPGYGYVRISQFQQRTGAELAAALEKLRRDNAGSLHGLILDLRNNPGGLLDQAVEVANRFIPASTDGGLIVYTKGRQDSSKMTFYASFGEKEPPYPMVVLINGGSASASEIVAGALQDQRRAVILGTQSFGKGSVQTMFPLRDNSGIFLTTARYYTPSGRSIQAKGITPDIVVGQLALAAGEKKGRQEFHEWNLENHIKPARKSGEKQQALPQTRTAGGLQQDYQLYRALELLKGWEVMGKIAGVK